MYGPSITHNEKHFAKKTTLKLDESLKKSFLFIPVYVKNGNMHVSDRNFVKGSIKKLIKTNVEISNGNVFHSKIH